MSEQNTYYQQRLEKLGINDELNSVRILRFDVNENKNVLKQEPIFRPDPKGIRIMVYTLEREMITYKMDGNRYSKDYSILRLEVPVVKENGDVMKYLLPKGAGSYPFFPPQLVDKYDARQHIPVLYLTEGYFKAFKGAMHGVDIVGLPSITHMKNKETGTLHPDILKLIEKCGCDRIVWLTDGDCLDISRKANDKDKKVDLYTRPKNFFTSVTTFKQLLDDYKVERYFAHVNSDEIVHLHPEVSRDDVKGLDDLLVAFPDHIPEIIKDLSSVSAPGIWFYKTNITFNIAKMAEYFRINNPLNFYLFHVDRGELQKNTRFIFHGTEYEYDDDKGEMKIIVPGEARFYFRVGTQYYKHVEIPNQFNQIEKQFHPWQKSTIIDDHGKNILSKIPRHEAFCNIPDHINYQPVIHNCFNVYLPLDYKPEDGEFTVFDSPTIMAFLTHIFGMSSVRYVHPITKAAKDVTVVDMALDYLQLLYLKPQIKLPILCLVSKEQKTGKSTFAFFVKQLFGGNCTIVGNQDIAGDFNKHWASRNVVIVDETKIDKQVVIEKVKNLSTNKKIILNAKGSDQIEIDCFLKFIFISNNEENFINIDEYDLRYWIHKVPSLKEENPAILENLISEIPQFLSFLSQRKLATDSVGRMHFHESLLKTEALKKVIEFSRPVVEKQMRDYLRDMFLLTGKNVIYMERNDINKEVFNNKIETSYLDKLLREKLKVEPWWIENGKDMFDQPIKKFTTKRYSYTRIETARGDRGKEERIQVEVNCGTGRPYVFPIEQFLTQDEINSLSLDQQYNSSMQPPDEPPPPVEEPKNDLPF